MGRRFAIAHIMSSGYRSEPHPRQLFWYQRTALIVSGSILLALLATGYWLIPDPRGVGTHEQLGLPPCTIHLLWGLRCPGCGMTTSWAYYVRGQWVNSAQANLGGMALAMLSTVLVPWALVSGARGRWCGQPVGEKVAVAIATTLVAVILMDWAIRLLID